MPFLRPDLDDLDGGWTDHLGGTSLAVTIDETTPSDVDFIQSSPNPNQDLVRLRFSDPSGIVDTGQPVTIRYRYAKDGPAVANVAARLKQGTTVIAEWLHENLLSSYVTAAQILTPGEKAAISNWNDLFLEFEANPPPINVFFEENFTASDNTQWALIQTDFTTPSLYNAASFRIINNALKVVNAGDNVWGNFIYDTQTIGPVQFVELDGVNWSSDPNLMSGQVYTIHRWQDVNNYYHFEITNYNRRWRKIINGVGTYLTTSIAIPSAEAVVRTEVDALGNGKVYYDGVEQTGAAVSGLTEITSGQPGFRLQHWGPFTASPIIDRLALGEF